MKKHIKISEVASLCFGFLCICQAKTIYSKQLTKQPQIRDTVTDIRMRKSYIISLYHLEHY